MIKIPAISDHVRVCIFSLLLATPSVLVAQKKVPPSERSAARASSTAASVQRARQLVAAGDSIAAIDVLRAAIEGDNQNGSLWHSYGMLLSEVNSVAHRSRQEAWSKEMVSRASAADSALSIAMTLEPDSMNFALDYADYMTQMRLGDETRATRLRRRAILMMENSPDSARVSAIADQIGLALWHAFEMNIGLTEFRHVEDIDDPLADTGPGGKSNNEIDGMSKLTTTSASPSIEAPQFRTSSGMLLYVKEEYPQPKVMLGAGAFAEIRRYARIASSLNPNDELIFRHEALMLAGMKEWTELGQIARARIAIRPQQAWPWLALGLSEYNERHTGSAMVAFDSGYARLSADEAERLSSIQRMMKAPQRSIYDTLSSAGRAQFREFYFNSANPSFLMPTNAVLAEFRARVAYAELRFTNDAAKLRGAESEAGDMWIRFGPPDYWVMRRQKFPASGRPINLWFYIPQHLALSFVQGPVTGSYHFTRGVRTMMEDYLPGVPSTFENLEVVRKGIDHVSAQVARFRATADSFDIVSFTGINAGKLRSESHAESSTIEHGMFVVNQLGSEIMRLTGTLKSSTREKNSWIAGSYRVRAPTSARGVRLEALEPDLLQVANAIVEFAPLNARGFGASELVIAGNVEPITGRPTTRWSDYNITALAGGLVERKAPVTLLWETYDAKEVNGNAHLRYTISFERQSSDGGFVARAFRAVGLLGNAVLGRNPADNSIALTYDRTIAASPVIVDQLKLDLGAQEPGKYRITLLVTDMNATLSKKTVQYFEIVK